MKKLIIFLILSFMGFANVNAQKSKVSYGLFNHVGIAASLGTDGIGLDVAAPVAPFAALRAGVTFWPKFKYNDTFTINDNNPTITPDVDIEGKLSVFDVKLLADLYPSKRGSFHFTAGLIFGNDNLLSAYNTSMFIKNPSMYGKLGLKLGDYRISTDKDGYVKADVKVNSFKPYVGIGFGRAVPRKSRVSVSCDIGVQFWGKPGLGAVVKDDWGEESYHKFKSSELDEYDDEDLKDALELAEKIVVFPVINIRISGRIF